MILGLCGFIGSGKGTAADILVQKYGFKKISFADSLKDCVSVVFGWDRKLLEGDTEDSRLFRERIDPFWSEKFGRDISERFDKNITPRYILQIVGTEVMRDSLLDQIWIHSLENKIQMGVNYVIPDVRFKNEIQFLKSKKAKIIEIVRPPSPPWRQDAWIQNKFGGSMMEAKYPDVHLSEWDWVGDDIEYVIQNDKSVKELEENIKKALTVLA